MTRTLRKGRAIPAPSNDNMKRHFRDEIAYFAKLPKGNVENYINITNETALKKNTAEKLNSIKIANPLAVTLTMKQSAYIYREGHTPYDGYEEIDKIKASKNLKHFMNILNNEIFFGNNLSPFKCRKRYLGIIPILEGKPYGEPKLHYHLVLERPEWLPEYMLCRLIRYYWPTTHFGDSEINIQPIYCKKGWLEYTLKTKKTNSLTYGEVDWMNLRE